MALLVIFITCKYQSYLSTPESSPELAAHSGIMVETRKIGDNPVFTVVFEPHLWDGHSPLKPMIYYHFSSADEIRAAFAYRPDVLETLNNLLNGDRSIKKKSGQNTALAAASYAVDAWIEKVGPPGGGNLKPQYWGAWSGTDRYDMKKREFWVWDILPYPEVQLEYKFVENDEVSDSGYTYYLEPPGCAIEVHDWMVEAKVSDEGVQKDYDSCGAYCDDEEAYPCD